MQNQHINQSFRLDPSRTAMILTLPGGQQLVFGLDWSPLVGMNLRKQGLKQSRALRATHYVIAGVGAKTLGLTRLKSDQGGRKLRLHSAAAHYAQRFPEGAYACLIPFENQGCWMVASHAGAILSNTDRWFSDLNAAYEAIEPIQKRFPLLQVQTEPILSEQNVPSWLLEKLTFDSRLQPVKRLSELIIRIVIIVLTLLCGGLYSAKDWWMTKPVLPIQAIDASELWRSTLQNLSGHIPIHSYQDLTEVMQTWNQVPVQPAGWKLKDILCEASSRMWNCTAHFDRQHKFSLNKDLELHVPANWSMQAFPLESASWVWQIPSGRSAHDWTSPPKSDDWMSYLQRIGMGFEHIQVGSGAALIVQPPSDAQGRPVPKPESLPKWRYRSLVVKGPLRSAALLEDLMVPVRWRRARLEISSPSGKVSASSSALNLELTGEIFEATHP